MMKTMTHDNAHCVSRRNKDERGVALIMAIMVTALVGLITVEISWRFELSASRSANRWHGTQARAYLEGAEHFAMTILKQDLEDEDTSQADHLGEPWAQETGPLPTDHGWISGRIEDAHGRFNLNLMKPEPGACRNGQRPQQQSGQCPFARTPCDNYTKAQQMFVRLLQTFNLAEEEGEEPVYLPVDQAEALTEAVIDWLDEDSEITGFGGAESDYYDQLEPPISIANKEMVSVSELQVIRGMVPQLYSQLLPNVIALPKEKLSRLNINTVKPNISRTIKTDENCNLSPHDEEIGQSLASFVAGGEFKDWQEMSDDVGLPPEWSDSSNAIKIPQELFTFGPSEYFLLFSETGIGEDHVRRGLSLIYRPAGASAANVGDGDGEDSSRGNEENSRGNQRRSGGDNDRNDGLRAAPGDGPAIQVVRRSDANF